jgi:hypothetical protein
MEKTSILTESGKKTIIIPAYYKDTQYEGSHYFYKVYKKDGELISLRIKLIQIDSFFTAELSTTYVGTAIGYEESNVLEWNSALGKVSELLTKHI